jgi:predicted transcriptional regulator
VSQGKTRPKRPRGPHRITLELAKQRPGSIERDVRMLEEFVSIPKLADYLKFFTEAELRVMNLMNAWMDDGGNVWEKQRKFARELDLTETSVSLILKRLEEEKRAIHRPKKHPRYPIRYSFWKKVLNSLCFKTRRDALTESDWKSIKEITDLYLEILSAVKTADLENFKRHLNRVLIAIKIYIEKREVTLSEENIERNSTPVFDGKAKSFSKAPKNKPNKKRRNRMLLRLEDCKKPRFARYYIGQLIEISDHYISEDALTEEDISKLVVGTNRYLKFLEEHEPFIQIDGGDEEDWKYGLSYMEFFDALPLVNYLKWQFGGNLKAGHFASKITFEGNQKWDALTEDEQDDLLQGKSQAGQVIGFRNYVRFVESMRIKEK